MATSLLLVLLLCTFHLDRVTSYRLTMSPDYVQTSADPQSVTFTCTADVALTGCQFIWRDDFNNIGPLVDLSRGSESRANSTHMDSNVTGYSYSGRGLGAGDCGVSLQVKGWKFWMVACRVRAETGGWTYAWSDLFATGWQHLPHTLTPRESVVLPGGEATFMLKAQDSLRYCRFVPPGLELDFNQGAQSPNSTGRHRYLGGGLGGGECGLALSNVSEVDNGPVGGYIYNTAGTKFDFRFMSLIVAGPPGTPDLSVAYTDAGVTATCVVHEARPVANISWVLGDVVVRQDSQDDRPGNAQDEWRWPWMKGSITQTLTLGLQATDNGKVLKCVVSHVALARTLEATETISFTVSSTVQPTTTPLTTTSTTARTTVQPSTTPLTTTSTTARTTVETSTTAPSPGTCNNESLGAITDPTCTATTMLGLLCQQYRVRASQLGNTSCTCDEVHEFRDREASAAARTAELVEEQAKITLEAAKSSAKADEETKAALAKVALEAAKSSAKADEETKAALAQVALEAAKFALEAAKSDEETKAALAQVALEAAKSSAKSDEETKAALAQVALEAAKSSAKAEEARARKEQAWAKNAEEELLFSRDRRTQRL